MLVDKILEDKEFGHLYIKTNSRAVRYTFKPAHDGSSDCGLLITVPTLYNLTHLLATVEQNRSALREILKDHPMAKASAINFDFLIQSDCLRISLQSHTGKDFFLRNEPAEIRKGADGVDDQIVHPAKMQLFCPEDTDFEAPGRQEWLQKVLVEGLRNHAKTQLISRMMAHARNHQICLHDVKVNTSKSHWGSCAQHKVPASTQGQKYYNINLSVFTLLLPIDVQRLILLHELMHTRHMDHSPAFHHDLDIWLNGREQELEDRLKRYRTHIFSFL